MKHKALFLDRDGVINIEKNYLYKIKDFEFVDGVFETCRLFQNAGYLIIIVTNQAGIARGLYTNEQYKLLTNWMLKQFRDNDISISKVYHCPHHPEFTGDCACRKPLPGMLNTAAEDFDLDMLESILVGDKLSDIQAGKTAGIKLNILVRSGHELTEYCEKEASLVIDSIANLQNMDLHK
jgi:D-glycero-D-manno-heptose 1,7-bisphosphate phosphatase